MLHIVYSQFVCHRYDSIRINQIQIINVYNVFTVRTALDRYWAITDPINYAQKRTVERVLLLIAGVWILSFIISSPPLIGWNDWPEEFASEFPCQLNSDKGKFW